MAKKRVAQRKSNHGRPRRRAAEAPQPLHQRSETVAWAHFALRLLVRIVVEAIMCVLGA